MGRREKASSDRYTKPGGNDGDCGTARTGGKRQHIDFPVDVRDVHGDWEHRRAAEDDLTHHGRDDDRGGDRNQAARPPLEQEQLDGQQDGGQRRIEGGRHAAGGTGDQQDLAFVGGQVQVLGEDRAESASSHDDRPLGAEWAAGADTDGR